jgi:hypothetical protein
MDRRVRYEVLRNEDVEEQAAGAPVALAMVEVPLEGSGEPSHAESNSMAATASEPVDTNIKMFVPPSYDVATELPSYEEAERTKLEEEQLRQEEEVNNVTSNDADPLHPGCLNQASNQNDPHLGTDGMFLCTFMISFVFNWIGLLASLCLTQSVAGRLGAMSGFGLSLVKWVAIVKHNNWIRGVADADSWLWWLLIILGFLIFFRGCTQYIRIKYQWSRLSQHVRNNIFYYF